MKAVLEIDMPDKCEDCQLLYDCYACMITEETIFDNDCENGKLKSCPLISKEEYLRRNSMVCMMK